MPMKNYLAGYGLGSTVLELNAYIAAPNADSLIYIGTPHNTFLEVFLLTGSLGISILLFVTYKTLTSKIEALQPDVRCNQSNISFLLSLGFFAFMIQSLTFSSGVVIFPYLYWVYLGLIFSIRKNYH
ncbi:hypothetical protein [Polynucleobacter sp. CS-Odin-A6]|uniref:hypothetical protein n=1 Tax=Polynucleobacter sp. CS-Odin-A6 TaxID=2689106 RepID=UPI001C0C6B8C|nr:hypothetical protein [Polynucleobacter sp. CS-Odin-A6]MBU3621113.1 hypothetical protein [Polynucleobacter sp. CS-Odin-A6]